MKQIFLALLSVMGATSVAYSGSRRAFYFTDEEGDSRCLGRLNAFTFYRLAVANGIQNPSAFAIANSTSLVKPSYPIWG